MACLVMMLDMSFFMIATTSTWKSWRVLLSLLLFVVGEFGEYSWSSSFSKILLNFAYFEVMIFLVILLCGLKMVVGFSVVVDLDGRDLVCLDLFFTCIMSSGLWSVFKVIGEDFGKIGDIVVGGSMVDNGSGFLIFINCLIPLCFVA